MVKKEDAFAWGIIGAGVITNIIPLIKKPKPPVTAGAKVSFAERIIKGWREANTIYTSRLGWGRNILVANYITIMPDVDGDYTVKWGFVNTAVIPWPTGEQTITMGGQYDMYTQVIKGLKQGVSSGAVFMPDQNSLAAYDYWTNFDNEGLYAYHVPPETNFFCHHHVKATVTSPSGRSITVEADWNDTMQYKLPTLSATLSFGERKLT
jgi:hypothetical protein